MNDRIPFTKKIFMLLLCFLFTGCASLQERIDDYSKDKVECYLNEVNVTEFSYNSVNYTILEDTVSKSEVSEWVGYIRKLAVLDEKGKILIQEDSEKTSIDSLVDIVDEYPNAKYIVPFNNVYTLKDDLDNLVVEVNGGYHKAVLTSHLANDDVIFNFKYATSNSNTFDINPDNATQLLNNGIVYQVTSKKVSNDNLGEFISIIAKQIIFDEDTKKPLSKDELNDIDWSGKNNQKRESWFYTGVYEISNIEISQNNTYYYATVQ